jgi:hypothetical protein
VLTVTGSSAVNFAATSTARLEASVQPLNADETRMTLLIAAVIILGSLFFISRTTGHGWLRALRAQRTDPETPVLAPAVVAAQNQPMRAYGDNRADITER